jgi:hypothetical protein
MSDAQTAETDDAAPPPAVDAEVERVARINGWRPKEEFKGDEKDWMPAARFLARGEQEPEILQRRNKILVSRFERLEHAHQHATQALETKLDGALETINHLTMMTRSAEQRAYERARRELKAEQAAAVTSGDTATFQRVDQQLEELEKTKPAEPPPVRTTPTPAAPLPDPAVQRFFAENPWYDTTGVRPERDAERMKFADMVYNGTKTTDPHFTEEQRLRVVSAEVRNRFPEKFRTATSTPQHTNGHDQTVTDRQDEPPAVMPSSGGVPPQRGGNRRTFDSMPKDSKDAYIKYDDQLRSYNEQRGLKHEPLSKAEWAATYWSQFTEI